ncbi:redoxin domain-containing protein [Streptomyces sp. NPDC051773]|uniref:TlpA family protein disulfide reductase n=1 Tax=Streptomyces sp. NPDC051773 TaxID=3156682 RepID=UPI003427AD15
MKTNPRAVLCAVVAGLVMTGCATPKPLPADAEQADGGGLFKSIPVGERPAAPDLTGGTVDGRSVRLSDYRGQVVVVNAWASTCGPCRVESPDLERAHRELKGRDVQVLGVSTDASRPNALAFERDLGLSYPSLYDPGGKQFLKLPDGLVNPRILPFTLFVDRAGRIAGAVQSTVTEEDVRSVVTPMLEEE